MAQGERKFRNKFTYEWKLNIGEKSTINQSRKDALNKRYWENWLFCAKINFAHTSSFVKKNNTVHMYYMPKCENQNFRIKCRRLSIKNAQKYLANKAKINIYNFRKSHLEANRKD